MINRQYLTIAIIIILTVSLGIWISGYNKVKIFADHQTIEYWTTADTVKEVIKDLEIKLEENDRISPAGESLLDDTQTITIFRGRKVTLHTDGSTRKMITPAETVKDFLHENHIFLAAKDLVLPDLNALITDGMEIRVTRIVEKEVIEEENIPFEKEYRDDSAQWKGQNKVIQKGKNGILLKTYVVTYTNAKEADRRLLKEEITRNPVKEIVARGTKQIAQRSGSNLDFKKTMLMNSTAYTHTGNRTYTGVWPQRGTVAVDPKVIPLGSKLYIDGYGYATAQDIGTAIVGERIDLFMDTKDEALKWGRRTVRVFVLN